MAKKFDEVRIPFTKMTFSPDVPSTALGPNEYNDGVNVETDVRGIRSTAGDLSFLENVPSRPTFVTGGYRLDINNDNKFYFIVACEDGTWHANNGDGTGWHDISPNGQPISGGYSQAQNITEAWNGAVPFFNDEKTAPMFWPQSTTTNWPNLVQYSQQTPLDIVDIVAVDGSTKRVYFADQDPVYPFQSGNVVLSNVQPRYYNGIWRIVAYSTNYVTIECNIQDPYQTSGTIQAEYTWNYNPNWSSVWATFMRLYNTPNVGSILVAGGLTAIPKTTANGNITSGSPTITYLTATNDMVNATVSGYGIPVGSKVISVSPGASITLDNNATATYNNNPITIIYDRQDTYPVTVLWSQAFGLNQAPVTWTPTVTNVANQLEVPLRGQVVDAFPCNGQFFLCSYWDTVVFSPINYATTSTPILGVRLFNQGRGLLSSNCWANTDKLVYGVDARDIWVFDGQDFQGIGNQRVKNWFYDQLNPAYYDRVFMEVNTQKNQVEIYYPDSTAVNGVPNKMLAYRYDLDCWNAPRDISNATFACESPIWTYSGGLWNNQPASRTVVYARGQDNKKLVQKDIGYTTADDGAITSRFVRDNIKLLPEYSGKLLVHRVLPEAVNIGAIPFTGDDEKPIIPSTGNITVQVSGALSVGQDPALRPQPPAVEMALDTDYPWIQVNQNASRVNQIEISNTSNTNVWMCSATTWQYTQTEDDH